MLPEIPLSTCHVSPSADPGFCKGIQLLKPKVADVVESCEQSEPCCRTHLGVFNAQICILPQSRDSFFSFLTASLTQKQIKIVHYIALQSISDIITPFAELHLITPRPRPFRSVTKATYKLKFFHRSNRIHIKLVIIPLLVSEALQDEN